MIQIVSCPHATVEFLAAYDSLVAVICQTGSESCWLSCVPLCRFAELVAGRLRGAERLSHASQVGPVQMLLATLDVTGAVSTEVGRSAVQCPPRGWKIILSAKQ